jgi:hypothetical protein
VRTGDYRIVTTGLGVFYALAYLHLLGDLDLRSDGAWGLVIGDPGAWLDRRGLMHFEPVAMLELGQVLLLASPPNLAFAASLGALLAVNLDGAWQLWRQPVACSLRSGRPVSGFAGSGPLAAVPALLAGGACCAPSLLMLLGIPALGALAGLFGWLLPASLALLLVSRILQRRRGAPRFLRSADAVPGSSA